MPNCKTIKVRIDSIDVHKSESYGFSFFGEPGNSAEWRVIFAVNGQSRLWAKDDIKNNSYGHTVGYDFFVDITKSEKLLITASGVEEDDSSANDELPAAEASHVPATNWDLGHNYSMSAASGDFSYTVHYTITCAENTDTVGSGLATDPMRVAGLWLGGNGSLRFLVNVTTDVFQKQTTDLFYQGLRMVNINTYKESENGQRLWGAIYREGTGASWCTTNLSIVDFLTLIGDRYKQSLRLLDAKTYVDNGVRRWAGVWGPGTYDCWFTPGLNEADFHSVNTSKFQKGLRLMTLDTYEEDGQRLFSGIWRAGNGASNCNTNLSINDLMNLANQRHKEGLRLRYIKTYYTSAGRRWAGNWSSGSEAGLFLRDMTIPDFVNTGNQQHQAGMRLVDFEVYK